MTWPNAWVDALHALTPLKTVPRAIQDAFATAWQGSASREFGLRRFVMADLLGQDALALDGLAVLLPLVLPDPMPATLYQMAFAEEVRAGRLGPWWTGERDFASTLWLATTTLRGWGGELVMLAAAAPASAIVYGADDLEILLDPRRLGPVRVVGVIWEEARAA